MVQSELKALSDEKGKKSHHETAERLRKNTVFKYLSEKKSILVQRQ